MIDFGMRATARLFLAKHGIVRRHYGTRPNLNMRVVRAPWAKWVDSCREDKANCSACTKTG